MVVFKNVSDLRYYIDNHLKTNSILGFVPTMGALHKGHMSLIKESQKQNDITIVSIFVNPTQFNDKEDFNKYPVTIEDDMAMLLEANCDILFIPSVNEIYPDGEQNMPVFDFGYLDTILEGEHRPGHFKGVGQVVARLLDIVQPNRLYLGQKDYQQCLVLKNLLVQTHKDIELIICPTMREADGLAMSSRNRRLTEPQRTIAGLIYQCLISIQAKQSSDNFELVKKECWELLEQKGFEPEYIALADADDLKPLANFDTSRKMTALIAAKISGVRLIDNMILN